MELSADLESLPEGLEFPAEFRQRIGFDPARRQLIFRGFMRAADYCFLHELSHDNAYRRALDWIYRDSTCMFESSAPLPLWIWVLSGLCFAAAAIIWGFWLVGTYEI